MKPRIESNMPSPVVIGVDIGKEVFHLVGFAADGKIGVDPVRWTVCRLGRVGFLEHLHLIGDWR